MPTLSRSIYTHLRQALYSVIRLNGGNDSKAEDSIRDAMDEIWDKMKVRDRDFLNSLPTPEDIKNLMEARK